jgi:hypothetical protein
MNKIIWLVFAATLMVLAIGMVSAVDSVVGCTNAWTYLGNESGNNSVTTGNVCINETLYDVAPTAGVNCGIWSNCIAGASSANEYYVGYDSLGACSGNNWVIAGTTASASNGHLILDSERADTCKEYAKGSNIAGAGAVLTSSNKGPGISSFIIVGALVVLGIVAYKKGWLKKK